MPKIHQPDISDPTEQRLRHLGDHLDAERIARHEHSADTQLDLTTDKSQRSAEPELPAFSSAVGQPADDGLRGLPYRWLGAAAVLLAIVTAGAVIFANRGGAALQTTSGTAPPTQATATPIDSIEPVATSSGPASSSTSPTEATVQAGSEITTNQQAATEPTTSSDSTWAFWPDWVSAPEESVTSEQGGETDSIATGPAGVIFASTTSTEDRKVVNIWFTTDGIYPEPVTTDGLLGLSAATVAATSDAYYVAATADDQAVLWRSTDGQNWTKLDEEFAGRLVPAVGPGPTLFRESRAGTLEWSADGLIWGPLEIDRADQDETTTYSVEGVRFVGGQFGYIGIAQVDDELALVESADGHRWEVLPAAPVVGVPASVEGGLIVIGSDVRTCDESCPENAYRLDAQTREWSPVATPPLGGDTQLGRVGDTLVASGVVDRDGVAAVEVFVSPVDEIEWTNVEITGVRAPIPTQTRGVHAALVASAGNRVIIPVPGPFGQFIVGAVADGGVADEGLAPLPMCDAATGPVAQDCVYEIVSGDNPTSIAQRFGIDVETLFAANADVAVPPLQVMLVGTRIVIPTPNG